MVGDQGSGYSIFELGVLRRDLAELYLQEFSQRFVRSSTVCNKSNKIRFGT